MTETVSQAEATRVWARVAALSFGGPAGQIATMHREVVEQRGWVSEARFLHALNFCMLLPGPEAQQLATYLGWLQGGVRGGLIAGGLFVLPGVVALMALSWLSVLAGETVIVRGLFTGLQAAVLVLVIEALLKVSKRALTTPFARVVALLAFLALFVFALPFPLVIGCAALAGFVAQRLGLIASPLMAETVNDGTRPRLSRAVKVIAVCLPLWLGPTLLLQVLAGPENVFSRLSLFFSEVAVVTFGGAYAVLAYVAQAAVQHFHWLSAADMLTGLGLAETTPGPLIMVLQYVGFLAAYRDPSTLSPLLAGTLGGLLVTWVTFAPCFLWVFLGAPYVEALRGVRWLSTALGAVTASVVGVIGSLALWFATHVLFAQTTRLQAVDVPVPASLDPFTAALAAVAAILLFRVKLGAMKTLGLCAVAGVVHAMM
ncbi:MAG: chromate efflux transporter [Acetobacteraceae bacterium]|nr:chromate efflux transporter [Acetobacteraceae bacterium]